MTALISPPDFSKCSWESSSGAALTTLVVKRAAAIDGRVEYSKPKSSFPSAFLTPAATAEARKPWGQTMSSVVSFKVNADVLLVVEAISIGPIRVSSFCYDELRRDNSDVSRFPIHSPKSARSACSAWSFWPCLLAEGRRSIPLGKGGHRGCGTNQ